MLDEYETIIKLIKSGRSRWPRHEGRRGMHLGF
jgi:hypothetical protein